VNANTTAADRIRKQFPGGGSDRHQADAPLNRPEFSQPLFGQLAGPGRLDRAPVGIHLTFGQIGQLLEGLTRSTGDAVGSRPKGHIVEVEACGESKAASFNTLPVHEEAQFVGNTPHAVAAKNANTKIDE